MTLTQLAEYLSVNLCTLENNIPITDEENARHKGFTKVTHTIDVDGATTSRIAKAISSARFEIVRKLNKRNKGHMIFGLPDQVSIFGPWSVPADHRCEACLFKLMKYSHGNVSFIAQTSENANFYRLRLTAFVMRSQ